MSDPGILLDVKKSPRSRSAIDQRKAAVWEWFSVFTQQLQGGSTKAVTLPRWASQGEVNAGALPVGIALPDGTHGIGQFAR
jgi:hypothetical protein